MLVEHFLCDVILTKSGDSSLASSFVAAKNLIARQDRETGRTQAGIAGIVKPSLAVRRDSIAETEEKS